MAGGVGQIAIDLFRFLIGGLGSAWFVCLTAAAWKFIGRARCKHRPFVVWGKLSMGIYAINVLCCGYLQQYGAFLWPSALLVLAEAVALTAVATGAAWLLGKNKVTKTLFLGSR